MTNLYHEANELNEELIKWRRDLHQIPELGITLPKTVAYVTAQLEAMNIKYTVLEACSCIVATIGSGEKCFLLRSDMDALPITEESGETFSSTNNNMHGCGHDVHCTVLLGAAKLLKRHEQELNGVVKLFFQSGEETFQGAACALQAGVLDAPKVNAAFALHVLPNTKVGTLLYSNTPMASVYGFQITITGHGGHGSQPESCIDPINAGVEIYHALQSLIARECPPKERAALTIGQFSAGNAANIIPETALLKGTLRTFNPETRRLLIRRIHEIVPTLGTAYRCKVEIEELSNVPNIVSDDSLNTFFLNSLNELDIITEINDDFHMMGSEDFAFISEKVPSSYFILGAGVEDSSKWLGLHNPKVIFNENVLSMGAAIYSKIAIDWLNKHK